MSDTVTIIIIGDQSVGKTSLAIRFCLNTSLEEFAPPTLDDTFTKQIVLDDRRCILNIIDTAGFEKYGSPKEHWIRQGDAFFLTYSITSQRSFADMAGYYNQIMGVMRASGSTGSSQPVPDGNLNHVPIIVIGTKVDRGKQREVSVKEGRAFAKHIGCAFFEISAKDEVDVEKPFQEVVRLYRKQQGHEPTDGSSYTNGSSHMNGKHIRPGLAAPDKRKSKRLQCRCVVS